MVTEIKSDKELQELASNTSIGTLTITPVTSISIPPKIKRLKIKDCTNTINMSMADTDLALILHNTDPSLLKYHSPPIRSLEIVLVNDIWKKVLPVMTDDDKDLPDIRKALAEEGYLGNSSIRIIDLKHISASIITIESYTNGAAKPRAFYCVRLPISKVSPNQAEKIRLVTHNWDSQYECFCKSERDVSATSDSGYRVIEF